MLSKRQKEILDFLKEFIGTQGYAPSLMEIAEHFGLSSPATVHQHMKALADKGFIQRGWNRKRHVEMLQPAAVSTDDTAELPLMGRIAAGQPIEAVADDETVSVPRAMVGSRGKHYALQVNGQSMIDDHILDGDLVVIRHAETASDGETVVALIDGENATLKRYYREGKRIRLQPANESMEPIVVDANAVQVQGVVVALLRRY
jgi:repressor LexA